MTESWRRVEGFPDYEVSSLGRIRRGSEIVTPYIDKNDGYLKVSLCNGSTVWCTDVHRVVALTWIPNLEHKPLISHINHRCDDNRADNLEWCSFTASKEVRDTCKADRGFDYSLLSSIL